MGNMIQEKNFRNQAVFFKTEELKEGSKCIDTLENGFGSCHFNRLESLVAINLQNCMINVEVCFAYDFSFQESSFFTKLHTFISKALLFDKPEMQSHI